MFLSRSTGGDAVPALIQPAYDYAGPPCGAAAAPPPLDAGVGEQCPQGTMRAGRAACGDCGRGLVHGGRDILAKDVGRCGTAVPVVCHATAVAGRPQSPWFAMRPQSQADRSRRGLPGDRSRRLRDAIERSPLIDRRAILTLYQWSPGESGGDAGLRGTPVCSYRQGTAVPGVCHATAVA